MLNKLIAGLVARRGVCDVNWFVFALCGVFVRQRVASLQVVKLMSLRA